MDFFECHCHCRCHFSLSLSLSPSTTSQQSTSRFPRTARCRSRRSAFRSTASLFLFLARSRCQCGSPPHPRDVAHCFSTFRTIHTQECLHCAFKIGATLALIRTHPALHLDAVDTVDDKRWKGRPIPSTITCRPSPPSARRCTSRNYITVVLTLHPTILLIIHTSPFHRRR